MITDAALAGPEYTVVHNPVAGEAAHTIVVHLDRKIHDIDTLGLFQEFHQASFEALDMNRRAVELRLADRDGIEIFRAGFRLRCYADHKTANELLSSEIL